MKSINSIEGNAVDVGIISVISTEIGALFEALGIDTESLEEIDSPLKYWRVNLYSSRSGRNLSIIVSVVTGQSGNTETAISTSYFLRDWYPRLMCLVGIAAGIKGKVRIGDVVIPNKIHDRTIKVFKDNKYAVRGSSYLRKGELERLLKIYPISLSDFKSLVKSDLKAELERATQTALEKGLSRQEYDGDLSLQDGSMASDNVVIRDSGYFSGMLEETDEKCRGGEMEAAGFLRACEAEFAGFPSIIFRGISDFGDDRKDDAFQMLAAKSACIALKLFLDKSLNIDHLPRNPRALKEERTIEFNVIGQLKRAYDSRRWQEVCRIGSVLSRPLWLSGYYEIRRSVGKMLEEAAGYCGNDIERARALIDDLGWTSYIMGSKEQAAKEITDGIRLAKETGDFYCVAKGQRHLASICRQDNDLINAEKHLNHAKKSAKRIRESSLKKEILASLLFSEGQLQVRKGEEESGVTLFNETLSAYRDMGDQEREVKIYSALGDALSKIGQKEEAKSNFVKGRDMALKLGRFDEFAENTRMLIELLPKDEEHQKFLLWKEVHDYAISNGLWNEARKWEITLDYGEGKKKNEE